MAEKEKYDMFAANQDDTEREYKKEKEHLFRSKFERDRDRILYSKEFRRLSGKTQVFVAGFDDHVRTRLTHALEVAQITRTICRALDLDEILGEAIAIGHDIGHTPFGHIGERTLNYVMNGCDDIKGMNKNLDRKHRGFKHNWQSIRVVMDLEEISKEYKGLNLTGYTLWGILNHSKIEYSGCGKELKDTKQCSLRQSLNKCQGSEEMLSLGFYDQYRYIIGDDAWTIEALTVRQADEIAQRHHDIEDALEANIIDKDDLVFEIKAHFKHWINGEHWEAELKEIEKENDKVSYLPMLSRLIVDFLTTKLVENFKSILNELKIKYKIENSSDFIKYKTTIRKDYELKGKTLFDIFNYEEELKLKEEEFQKYLSNMILNSFLAQSMDGKSNYMIRQLIKAYVSNPQQLPDKTIVTLYKNYMTNSQWDTYKIKPFKNIVGELRNRLNRDHFNKLNEGYKQILLRTICDYIAGMTDNYAIEQFNLLYGSKHVGQM